MTEWDGTGHNRFRVTGRGMYCTGCRAWIRTGDIAGYNDDQVVCEDCWSCERDYCGEC